MAGGYHVIAGGAKQSGGLLARGLDCFVACAPCNDGGAFEREAQPPRSGGIVTWSRRQPRRSISSQARNCRSLLMQIRTSLSRVLLQVTEIAALLRPGLTLMKASSISAGATVLGSDNSRNSGGIFTAVRALRMVSK